MITKKSAWDRFLEEQIASSPTFAEEYAKAKAEIDETDRRVNALLTITPEFRQLIHSVDNDVSDIISKMDRLFTFLRKTVRDHGGQLHKSGDECKLCYASERTKLEKEHPNWRQETASRMLRIVRRACNRVLSQAAITSNSHRCTKC